MSLYIAQYAQELERFRKQFSIEFAVELSNYDSNSIGKSVEEILRFSYSKSDFLDIAAQVHGFQSYVELENENSTLDFKFESAVDAVVNGNASILFKLLEKDPNLIYRSSSFGHRAQLIHYCSANAIEIYRQTIPKNLNKIVQILLEFGANPNQKIPVYKGHYDFYELFDSSAHPKDAEIKLEIN